MNDPAGLRVHLWRDAVGFSPHDIPLQFKVRDTAVERIRIPFRDYDCIANGVAFICRGVAANRTVYCFQSLHFYPSSSSLRVCATQEAGQHNQYGKEGLDLLIGSSGV
jgi:hypothetical protein